MLYSIKGVLLVIFKNVRSKARHLVTTGIFIGEIPVPSLLTMGFYLSTGIKTVQPVMRSKRRLSKNGNAEWEKTFLRSDSRIFRMNLPSRPITCGPGSFALNSISNPTTTAGHTLAAESSFQGMQFLPVSLTSCGLRRTKCFSFKRTTGSFGSLGVKDIYMI